MEPRTRFLAAFAAAACLLAAAPARSDQLIAEDLVVQGQGDCMGFDCTGLESFPFGSIRLKENNLRIRFDDTSDPLLAPANDWQIIANDSASGGANYLSLEDATTLLVPFRVDGGAPSNALVIAPSGAVGLGTATPSARLHAVGSVRVNGDLAVTRAVQSGVVAASALVKRAGSVTFAQPAAADYAIALTPIGATPKAKLEVWLTGRDANGFTFVVSGKLEDLSGVAWTVRELGEH
jgi:hypothetical protein